MVKSKIRQLLKKSEKVNEKNSKFKITAVVISVCVLIMPFTSISALQLNNKTDILLVKIGSDEIINETFDIMEEILSKQNDKWEKANEQNWVDSLEQNKMLSIITNSKINLNVISSHYLKFKGIEISIDDLANGILETYDTSIIVTIGHGSPLSLSDGIEEMPWENLNTILEETKFPLSILATCYGGKAAMDSTSIIGIEDQIDNKFAAYLFTALIYKTFGDVLAQKYVIEKVFNRMQEFSINPELSKFLSISEDEWIFWSLYIVVAILQIFIGALTTVKGKLGEKLLTYMILNGLAGGILAIKVLMELYTKGDISILTLFTSSVGYIITWLGYALTVIGQQSIWWKILYGFLTAAEIFVMVATALTTKVLTFISSAAAFIFITTSLWREDKDSNNVPSLF